MNKIVYIGIIVALSGATTSFGITNQDLLFHYAAIGNLSEVKRLVQKPDVDINKISAQGKTALMYAAFNNNVDVVNFLLHLITIQVNTVVPPGHPHEGHTALYLAVVNNAPEAVEAILFGEHNIPSLGVEEPSWSETMQLSLNRRDPKIFQLINRYLFEKI